MYRLGHFIDAQEAEYSHPRVFLMPAPEAPYQRILAGIPGSDPDVLLRLTRCLEGPLVLLYVLHTSGGEAELGRYQSPELSLQEVEGFFAEFSSFLSADARFDLWVYSPKQRATLVWDRHNLLHAYGHLECFAAGLRSLGFGPGEPVVPAPHTHHYHAALDPLARQLIDRFDWRYSPLRPEDEQ
ncbi:hypothetical protein [Montanilutibacter psychrotolerans]|uniref:Uncharacterized protein n=1 Tax=Montanilutibacter psychrotolerans TaxID=1327343 RepID=A0A3M8SYG1_9GAMM|nr:hypothetical protein [Lysobacter psychrotolerans]RNF83592.1 hypothetical protein EER27_09365 [Lysobacter psychrotolerans]